MTSKEKFESAKIGGFTFHFKPHPLLDNTMPMSFEEFIRRQQNEQSRKQISSLLKQYYANP